MSFYFNGFFALVSLGIFKSSRMKPIENDDITLSNEIRSSLNGDVNSLDASIISQLRQARFKAIDHAIPTQGRISYANTYQWGMGAALALVVVVSVLTQVISSPINGLIVTNDTSGSLGAPSKNADTSIDEDTEEEVEMYEWLYKNYG